jgi:hypothetical protein
MNATTAKWPTAPGELAVSGGYDGTPATLVQARWDLVALIVGFVGFVRATAKSRRAASAEHSGCCVALHTYHDAGAMPRLPGLPSFGP